MIRSSGAVYNFNGDNVTVRRENNSVSLETIFKKVIQTLMSLYVFQVQYQ